MESLRRLYNTLWRWADDNGLQMPMQRISVQDAGIAELETDILAFMRCIEAYVMFLHDEVR